MRIWILPTKIWILSNSKSRKTVRQQPFSKVKTKQHMNSCMAAEQCLAISCCQHQWLLSLCLAHGAFSVAACKTANCGSCSMVQAAYVLCRSLLLANVNMTGLELVMVGGVIQRNAVDSLLAQWYCCSAASCFTCLLLPTSMESSRLYVTRLQPLGRCSSQTLTRTNANQVEQAFTQIAWSCNNYRHPLPSFIVMTGGSDARPGSR